MLSIYQSRIAIHGAKQRVKRCNPQLAYAFSSGREALLSELLLVK
jgi:hypothetical protein